MSHDALLSQLLHREHLETLAVAGELEARVDDRRAGPINVGDEADRAQLQALIHMAEADIGRHYRFEEEVLFPKLAAAGLGPMVEVLVMEHDSVRAIVVPLRTTAEAALADGFTKATWSTFRDGVFDLINSVSFHIQKEELGVIRQLATVLGVDADRDLGRLYATFR
ncbi:MAG: hemerythrin domain-containing protein [Rhodospirillales bacterium]|jgi:hemerythrin-like domain-containing protein|nr:hemerythrin domain-containing protein [Rhodospirillales bacterium]